MCAQLAYGNNISVKINAIVPTSHGQIGVNPITDIPLDVYKNISPNTKWYQADGTTTKWIGVNTEYLTDLPYTTTINNKPSVTTVPAAVVAVTATASGKGVAPGDVSIAFSPKVIDVFNNLASEAAESCARLRKRLLCNVRVRFAQRVAAEARPGGLLSFIDSAVQGALPVVSAGDVAAITQGAQVAGGLVSLAVAWHILGKLSAITLPKAWLIGGGGGGDDDKRKKCPANAPKGVNAPFCSEKDCGGDSTNRNQKCKQGKYNNCECLATGEVVGAYKADMKMYDDKQIWLDEQQKLLGDLYNKKNKAPFCVHGGSPRGERIPKEYCNCGEYGDYSLTYSVATSTTNECPYTTDNGPTVTFQEASATPTPTPSVSCNEPKDKWFSSSQGFDFIHMFCMKSRQLAISRGPDTFSNAQIETYDIEDNKMVEIYAYVDEKCRDKLSIPMDATDCIEGLDSIMHDCDGGTEANKMGGAVSIDCQWFHIEAVKKPPNLGPCPTC